MNEQMKQYTGTKTVKAMPMTMGEAYERKLLKEGVRPSECETDKAGYLVEYEGVTSLGVRQMCSRRLTSRLKHTSTACALSMTN